MNQAPDSWISDAELMQTELHHLQTLHIMASVFRRGMREEVQLDADVAERVFPCLDQLLLFHHAFFTAMKERRQASAQPQGHRNYLIQKVGDILLQQVSWSPVMPLWDVISGKWWITSFACAVFFCSFRMRMGSKWSRCTENSAVVTTKRSASSKTSSSITSGFRTSLRYFTFSHQRLFVNGNFKHFYNSYCILSSNKAIILWWGGGRFQSASCWSPKGLQSTQYCWSASSNIPKVSYLLPSAGNGIKYLTFQL